MKQKKRGKKAPQKERTMPGTKKHVAQEAPQKTKYEIAFPKATDYGLEILPRIYICNECNKVLHFDIGEKARLEMKCDTFLYQIKTAISELVYSVFAFIVKRSLVPGIFDRCLHRGNADNYEQIKHAFTRRAIDYFDGRPVTETELIALLVYLYFHKKGPDEK